MVKAAADGGTTPLQLRAGVPQQPLAGHFHLWRDASGHLSLEDMVRSTRHGSAPRLRGSFSAVAGQGGVFWLQLPLQVEDGAPDWLVLDAPWIELLDLYVTAGDDHALIWQRQAGLQRPAEQRDLAFSAITLHLPLAAGGYTLWMRAAGLHALTLDGAFWQLPAFTEHYLRERGALLALAGVMLAMGLFGLCGGVLVRVAALRWYGVYSISAVCVGLFGSGAVISLLSLPYQSSAKLVAAAACLMVTAGNHAVIHTFQLAQHARVLAAWLVALGYLMAGLALLALLGYHQSFAVMLAVVAASLVSGFISVAVALPLLWRGRHRCAVLFYLLGMVPLGVPLLFAQLHQLSGLHISLALAQGAPSSSPVTGTLAQEMLRAGHLLMLLIGLVLWFIGRHRVQRSAGRERERLARSQLLKQGERMAERNRVLKNALQVRRKVERQLTDVLGQQRSFLAMVSHEFRTPLSVISLVAHNIQRRHADDPHTREDVARVKRASRRLSNLVDACLNNERLDTAMLQLNAHRSDLVPMLTELCEQRRIVTGRPVELAVLQAPLWMHMDTVLVQMVFDNLLDNAIKYAPGLVRVEAQRRASGAVEVAVSDFGPGVASQERPRIFDRYYRSPALLRQVGNGLGLYLVRRIMALHGGEVWLDSRYQEGARFVVRFPPPASEQAPAPLH